MSRHATLLRQYVHSVAQDMLQRGVIRKQRGQLIEDVVLSEGRAILAEIEADLIEIGTEMGLGALSFGARFLEQVATQGIARGVRAAADVLFPKKKGG